MKTSVMFLTALILSLTLPMSGAQNPIFPNKDLIATGVYYYADHWPPEQWERDLKNIADLGFEFAHFGEFAWAFMEPEEGKFDFAWLDRTGMQDVFARTQIPVRDYPAGVVINWVNGAWIGVNYSDKPYRLEVGKKTKFLIGGEEIPVAGVSVWIESRDPENRLFRH